MQSLQVLFISRRCSSQYLSIANAQLPTLTTLRSQAYLRVSVEVPYAVLANSDHPQRHLLGNIARVVGRDASRASAQVGDLYVALSEDEAIYGLFKTMKGNYLSVSGSHFTEACANRSPYSPGTNRAPGQDLTSSSTRQIVLPGSEPIPISCDIPSTANFCRQDALLIN
jgi:hypothetical protein